MVEFKSTALELEFSDISSEKFREYTFPGGDVVRIDKPQRLAVTESGHRVFDAAGVSHYLPRTFIHLRWEAFEGQPNFVR